MADVSVAGLLAPKLCVGPLIHARVLFLSAIAAGLLDERAPFTANRTEPNRLRTPPLHPACPPPPDVLRPLGRSRVMVSHVLQMG